jgi:hypothetical protein
VNWSLSNTLTPKNVKSAFLETEVWLFNRDIFIDKDFSPFSVTDRSVQDEKP